VTFPCQGSVLTIPIVSWTWCKWEWEGIHVEFCHEEKAMACCAKSSRGTSQPSPPPSLLQKTNIPAYINYVLTNNLNKQRGNKSVQNYNYWYLTQITVIHSSSIKLIKYWTNHAIHQSIFVTNIK